MVKKIKVLIIDDSAFMRRVVSDIIDTDNRLEVIGIAKNGKEGLEKALDLQPDVITLDIEMPIMNGLDMLKILQEKKPIPVIMLSTLVEEGAKETIKALELGAYDFIKKPDNIFKASTDAIRQELIGKIVSASKLSKRNFVLKAPSTSIRTSQSIGASKKTLVTNKNAYMIKNLVALGTSTGGPRALQYVLPYLPANLNAGIVIVQHMPPGFTKSLSERLNQLSQISVKEAENGDIIENGKAYIAPGDRHLLVEKDKKGHLYIKLSDGPPVGAHKPAVDAMMDSIIPLKDKHLIGVIMTGMGADGMKGMTNVKNNNPFHIIAQNEETCVVYGMPKAAVNANIVDEIVPLDQIANAIVKQTGVLK